MAYRTFRNEELYDAPELGDMAFTKAAFQAMDAADAQRRGIAAQKQAAKDKHSQAVISSLESVTPSPFKKFNENTRSEILGVTSSVLANGGTPSIEDIARANAISARSGLGKGMTERYNQQQLKLNALEKDYPLDRKIIENDYSSIHEQDDPNVTMDLIDQNLGEGKYLDLAKATNDFYKSKKELAVAQNRESENEQDYTTSTFKYKSKPVFSVKTDNIIGYKTVLKDGKEVKEPVFEQKPATTPDEVIKSGAIDDLLALPYGPDMLKKTRSLIPKDEILRKADDVAKKTNGYIFNEKGSPSVDPFIVETVTNELAKKELATRLANMHKIEETVSSSITKENPPRPRSNPRPSNAGGTGLGGVLAAGRDFTFGQTVNRGGGEKKTVLHLPNSVSLSSIDTKGNVTTPKPISLSMSTGRNSEGTLVEILNGQTMGTPTGIFDAVSINGKYMNFDAEDKDGNKIPPPSFEQLKSMITNAPPGQKVLVEPATIVNIVGKDNSGGVMTIEDMAELNRLESKYSGKKLSKYATDPAEAAERTRWNILKARKQNANQTIWTTEKGVFSQATGWGSQQDAINDPSVDRSVKDRFEKSLELQRLAKEHNDKIGAKYDKNNPASIMAYLKSKHGNNKEAAKAEYMQITSGK